MALYGLFVALGWLVVSGGSPIEFRLVLLGPLLPIAHTIRYAPNPAHDADVWLGAITLIPFGAWWVAARWYRQVWFEALAVVTVVGLYALLLFSLGLGA